MKFVYPCVATPQNGENIKESDGGDEKIDLIDIIRKHRSCTRAMRDVAATKVNDVSQKEIKNLLYIQSIVERRSDANDQ